jgi:hypothetical protein
MDELQVAMSATTKSKICDHYNVLNVAPTIPSSAERQLGARRVEMGKVFCNLAGRRKFPIAGTARGNKLREVAVFGSNIGISTVSESKYPRPQTVACRNLPE